MKIKIRITAISAAIASLLLVTSYAHAQFITPCYDANGNMIFPAPVECTYKSDPSLHIIDQMVADSDARKASLDLYDRTQAEQKLKKALAIIGGCENIVSIQNNTVHYTLNGDQRSSIIYDAYLLKLIEDAKRNCEKGRAPKTDMTCVSKMLAALQKCREEVAQDPEFPKMTRVQQKEALKPCVQVAERAKLNCQASRAADRLNASNPSLSNRN